LGGGQACAHGTWVCIASMVGVMFHIINK
jgi:hypothetical protein